MPRTVCNQPSGLFDACLKNAALNIDVILAFEESLHLTSDSSNHLKFRQMPSSMQNLISDAVFEFGVIHDDNYSKILSEQTRNILFRKDDCKIKNISGFLKFLHQHCKNVEKIDLSALLKGWDVDIKIRNTLVGEALSSVVNLEWIALRDSIINDQCLEFIGSKCAKLKYLDVCANEGITNNGIRALCDPLKVGNCSQLTHLLVEQTFVTPDGISLALLHCPNLEIIRPLNQRSPLTEVTRAINHRYPLGLIKAMGAIDSSVVDMLGNYCGVHLNLPYNSEMSRDAHRIFRIIVIEFDCRKVNTAFLKPFFEYVGQYCPHLNTVAIISPELSDGDLHGISHLSLQSVRFDLSAISPNPLHLEALLLLRSVGNSLTKLSLSGCSFDLKVIARECPNLTSFHLDVCDTSRIIPNWPYYPAEELQSSSFGALTDLSLKTSSISSAKFSVLLSHRNIETLELSTCFSVPTANIIKRVLMECPVAFCRLQSVKFIDIEINRHVLSGFLERAALLESICIGFSSSFQNGRSTRFNDKPYFDELIENNNWDLSMKWNELN